MRKLTTRLFLFLFIFLIPLPLFAVNGAFDNGYSSITRGMGGAGAALPQDSIIAAINPAGMVFVGSRLDSGFAFYLPNFAYRADAGVTGALRLLVAPGRHYNLKDLVVLPDFGFNMMLGPKMSFGVTLYSLGGFGTTYKTTAQAQLPIVPPAPPFNTASGGVYGAGTVRSLLRQAILALTVAHKLGKRSSIGISLLIGAQTFKAEGLSSLSSLSIDPNNLSDRRTDYSYGAGFRVGLLWGILKNLSIAGSFQPTMHMTRFDKYAGLFGDRGRFNIPMNGLIAIAWHIVHNLVLAFDVQHIWYTDVPTYGNPDTALTNGICSLNSNTCLGGDYTAGFGWRNLTTYKIGFQWQSSLTWLWRVGYDYGHTVVRRNQTVEAIIAPGAIIEHVLTAGFTHILSKSYRVNAFFTWVPMQKLSGINGFSGGTQTVQIRTNGFGFGFGLTWILG